MGYYAFDLDKTLAYFPPKKGQSIGDPVPAMMDILKRHIAKGDECRIMTARVSHDPDGAAHKEIIEWLIKHLGQELIVQNYKCFGLITLYDDSAIQVEVNTGRLIGDHARL